MSQAASLRKSVGQRYATALFEIASDANSVSDTENELKSLGASIDESGELQDFLTSPLFTREQQGNAVGAIADKAGLSGPVKNTLLLMAQKGRLFAVTAFIEAFEELAAKSREQITAEVRSATDLSDEQLASLKDVIKNKIGKDVAIDLQVDESLIGGLVVKVGSTMIDSSLAGKLSRIHNAMKEVG